LLYNTSRESFNQVGSGDSNNQGGEVWVAHQNINKGALAENDLEQNDITAINVQLQLSFFQLLQIRNKMQQEFIELFA
jgi:hypothetical protein